MTLSNDFQQTCLNRNMFFVTIYANFRRPNMGDADDGFYSLFPKNIPFSANFHLKQLLACQMQFYCILTINNTFDMYVNNNNTPII